MSNLNVSIKNKSLPSIDVSSESLVPKSLLLSFILVTCCFALWGFANDITNPMVAAFQKNIFDKCN